jgi:hypothetical protein
MLIRPAPVPLPQLESEYHREDEATWLPEVEGRGFTPFEAVKKSSGGEREKRSDYDFVIAFIFPASSESGQPHLCSPPAPSLWSPPLPAHVPSPLPFSNPLSAPLAPTPRGVRTRPPPASRGDRRLARLRSRCSFYPRRKHGRPGLPRVPGEALSRGCGACGPPQTRAHRLAPAAAAAPAPPAAASSPSARGSTHHQGLCSSAAAAAPARCLWCLLRGRGAVSAPSPCSPFPPPWPSAARAASAAAPSAAWGSGIGRRGLGAAAALWWLPDGLGLWRPVECHAGLLVSAVPGLCLSGRRRPGAGGHVPWGPGEGPTGRVGPSVPGGAADCATDRGTRGQQGHPSTAGLVPATCLSEPLREASTHPLPGQGEGGVRFLNEMPHTCSFQTKHLTIHRPTCHPLSQLTYWRPFYPLVPPSYGLLIPLPT